MTMTYDEVAELLAFCAVHDKRKGGDVDVQAWLMTAADHNWTAAVAFRVAREHYGQGAGRPRLEAPAITDRIRDIRRKAAATFPLPVIPDDLPNADYPAWLRAQRDAHVAAILQAWAVSGQEPPVQLPPPPPSEIGQRRVAELTAGAFQDIPSAADPAGNPPTPEAMQVRSSAFATACPYCGARPDDPCTRAGVGGRVRISRPHPARLSHIPSSSEEAS